MKGRRHMELKATIKMAGRSWLMMVIIAVLEFMFFPALVAGNDLLRIVINSAVLLAGLMFGFANGANLGESEISYGEMLDKRVAGGYKAMDYDLAKCYSRKRGVLAFLLGALPWVIMSVVVLVTGMGFEHKVAAETPDYLFPDAEAMTMATHEVVDMVARVSFAAFMGFFEFIDKMGAGTLDYFFLPMSFIYPLAIFIGYLTGPMQHKKKLQMIDEGKKKKLRKIRADQKRKKRQQQPRQPKPEV